MDESIDGVVKLDAAKRSLEPSIRALPSDASLGIWTYPAADASCTAGEWLVDLGSDHDVTQVIAAVDAATTNGDTPTALAIEGVVEELRSRGIDAANLVLVSDGHSNCGEDPCVAAEGLAGTGFDVSIQAVGFAIDEEGRDELECIARATGGHYFDVSDGAGLEDVLAELTTPRLTLRVDAERAPRAGAATTLTATISNPSSFIAHDVRVSLTFDPGGPSVSDVVPATIRVGNLPAGTVSTRTWTVVLGEDGAQGTVDYTLSAWSIEAAPVQVTGSFRTRPGAYDTDDLGDIFAPVLVDGRSLVIMGDSYSSGEGTGSYLPESPDAAALCHRSSRTYLAPEFDAAGIPVDILACSGATTKDFADEQWGGSHRIAARQLAQLRGLTNVPGAVVMTAGGNDIHFADIVKGCIASVLTQSCARPRQFADAVIASPSRLQDQLESTYVDVWEALNDPSRLAQRNGDYAPVIVVGYPQVTHDSSKGVCDGAFDASEVRFANDLVNSLNASIERAVDAARVRGYEVYFVGQTHDVMLPGHTVCAPESQRWINAIVLDSQSASYHPNVAGYEAIGQAIITWSLVAERVPPEGEAKRRSREPGVLDNLATAWATSGIASIDLDRVASQRVSPRQQLAVTGSGFAPGSPVVLTLHSMPQLIGVLIADEDGRVDSGVRLPADAAVGAHDLIVQGVDADGGAIERTIPVNVVPPFPLWLLVVLIGSALAAIGSVVLFLLARRRGRADAAG
jgi:hypothetical protein